MVSKWKSLNYNAIPIGNAIHDSKVLDESSISWCSTPGRTIQPLPFYNEPTSKQDATIYVDPIPPYARSEVICQLSTTTHYARCLERHNHNPCDLCDRREWVAKLKSLHQL